MSVVSGLDWQACSELLEKRMPGSVAQAITDADTFFGVELPALTEWTFGAEEAARLNRPVLSVIGTDTQPVWVQTAEVLRSWLPHVEEARIQGVGHLLHIERSEPVAHAIAEFLTRNPIAADDTRRVRLDDPARQLIASRA
jgi:pimeloyl-ACP methyl ester carboxylesterase